MDEFGGGRHRNLNRDLLGCGVLGGPGLRNGLGGVGGNLPTLLGEGSRCHLFFIFIIIILLLFRGCRGVLALHRDFGIGVFTGGQRGLLTPRRGAGGAPGISRLLGVFGFRLGDDGAFGLSLGGLRRLRNSSKDDERGALSCPPRCREVPKIALQHGGHAPAILRALRQGTER